ncbi:hypothetical protein [Grimontia hollisae]|uniref:hypothetical protein n=2 Tax=Grimontia hollisae TaxID=673 RepID=UPI00189C896B|nr:hypothetical protein [Grimontia hollisae]
MFIACIGMTDPTDNPNFTVGYWMRTHHLTVVQYLDESFKVTVFSNGFAQLSLALKQQ